MTFKSPPPIYRVGATVMGLVMHGAVTAGAQIPDQEQAVPWLGSWKGTVRDPEKTERLDHGATVEALLATGQNFHIVPVDSQVEWEEFNALLVEADGTCLRLLASMKSPHLAYDQSRWFDCGDSDGDGHDDCGPPPVRAEYCKDLGRGDAEWLCRREYMRLWIDAWTRCATTLSDLSRSYPKNLVGFVIDDFMRYIDSGDTPACVTGDLVTHQEIAEIHSACHSINPNFGFYPTIGFDTIGRVVTPGYVLGTGYGVQLWGGDSMTVRLDVPVLSGAVRARLSYFESVSDGCTETEVHRTVSVTHDGSVTELLWPPVPLDADQPVVAYSSHDIVLHHGLNSVDFTLTAAPSGDRTSGCGSNEFWYVWDVKVEALVIRNGTSHRVEYPLFPRFEVCGDDTPYVPTPDCRGMWFPDVGVEMSNLDDRSDVWDACEPELTDDEYDGYFKHQLVCGPNDRYLIQDVVDGIIPYHGTTDSKGTSDALDPDHHFADLLRSTARAMGDGRILPFQWAIAPVDPLDPAVIEERLAVAIDTVGAAGVWHYPLNLHFSDPSNREGVFAMTPPVGTEHQLAQWPSRFPAIPGWYQTWEHVPASGGVDMRIEVSDSRDPNDEHFGALVKFVQVGDVVVYEADPWADDQASVFVPSDGSYLTSTPDAPVLIGMSGIRSPSIYLRTFFESTDGAGKDIPVGDWAFHSGCSDAHTIEIFQRVRDLYLLH